jgi:hypothetical protein
MKTYIGCKVIQAEPMTKGEFEKRHGRKIASPRGPDTAGYSVVYPLDGYASWSPADAFERAYREVGDDELAILGRHNEG